MPHLGIASLAAYLRQNGIKVTCSDFRLISPDVPRLFSATNHYNHETGHAYVSEIPDLPLVLCLIENYKQKRPILAGLKDAILNFAAYESWDCLKLIECIEKFYSVMEREIAVLVKHDMVGFTVVTSNYFFTIMLSIMLKKVRPDIKIIYGGPQVTLSLSFARICLKSRIADVVILGEGEHSLLKTIRSHASNSFVIDSQKEVLDIDTLPDPDFSIFKIEKYKPLTLPVYASRGCAFRCSFCTYHNLIRYRLKDPCKVVDSIEHMSRKYKTKRFLFTDSALNTNSGWLDCFLEELIKRRCGFQWEGYFSPHISNGLSQKLKESGLYYAMLGGESFSSSVLKGMGKGVVSGKKIISAIESLCSAGVKVGMGVITGFPGESKKSFFRTWEQLEGLKDRYQERFSINPHLFQLRPSSRCYKRHLDYGVKIKKWDRRIRGLIPELSGIIKDVPMIFYGQKPGSRETIRRFKMIKAIDKFLVKHENL